MLRRSQQVMLNAHADVERWIREALAITERVEAPDELRAAVYTSAVNLLSASHCQLEESGIAHPVFSGRPQ